MSTVELVEQIDVRLLANLSQNFRSPYEAIFELVDNGLASKLPGQPMCVTISGSGAINGALTITTKGGAGMGALGLQGFLHWGREPEEIGLHRYGQGGKAAIGYLGRGLRVRANRHDEDVAYDFEDLDWLSRPDGQPKRFRPRVGPPAVPGTGVVQIDILGLRKVINFKKLERELAWRYRPALMDESLRLTVGRARVEPVALAAENRREFEDSLLVPSLEDATNMVSVTVRGWVGVAPPKFEDKGGIRCSAHARVVERSEYFGHKDMTFKASLNSLVGEVDLSFVPVVLNKTSFDTASPHWQAAAGVMHDLMQPYVDQLLRRKEVNEPSEEERLRAMEAKDIAHRALDKIAAEAERRGLGGEVAGRKPPEPRQKRLEEVLQPQATQRLTPQPKTPPPPDAVGRLRRTGSAVDWDVRALDSKIRSATEQTDGRIEIVINSQFPVYKLRGGDMLYMVETGLLEELKPVNDEDEKTVYEYVEQVADALYIAAGEGVTGRGSR
jgi:hypothetical protein